jgi:hypothetical protein
MEANNNNTFFPKVCQLDNTTASPKHPQSEIGSSIASHNVNGVINDISSTKVRGAIIRRIPKNKYTPKQNSKIPNRTAIRKGRKSGKTSDQPKAMR